MEYGQYCAVRGVSEEKNLIQMNQEIVDQEIEWLEGLPPEYYVEEIADELRGFAENPEALAREIIERCGDADTIRVIISCAVYDEYGNVLYELMPDDLYYESDDGICVVRYCPRA